MSFMEFLKKMFGKKECCGGGQHVEHGAQNQPLEQQQQTNQTDEQNNTETNQ